MLQNIPAQIDNINSALQWIKDHKPADYATRFLQLVDERRKLRKLLRADSDNPAIAAYGVSQVGKSYLMNSMLQKDGKKFIFRCQEGEYEFIEEMNPQTKNTEATGVVTRFSSFSRNPDAYSFRYPVLMRTLSLADIILVLCEGYFNDVKDYKTISDDEIKNQGEAFYRTYAQKPVIEGSPLTADDVIDIREYFRKNINNAQSLSRPENHFFENIALVADRIPASDWVDVFSILWSYSPYQTKLFEKMLSTMAKLDYSTYVYLPAQSMVHGGTNENTIVSVQCLNQLFEETPTYTTTAYLKQPGGSFKAVPDLSKSEICAVCAEIVVKIDDDLLSITDCYCMEGIDDVRTASILSKSESASTNRRFANADKYRGSVAMNILQSNDLLDFPGARTRKKEQLDTLAENAILINVLLRGKVAYLFNMYNEGRLINILLYCHHGEKNEVTDMPILLRNWIMTYVGDTMAKRAKTLELTGGISPLFYIATKFNMDLQREDNDTANSDNALNGRWQQRFQKVLYAECFNADGCLDNERQQVFLNWTRPGERFSNSFLLRDYKYSGPLYSALYENERNATVPATMLLPDDYYRRLRATFIDSPHVQQFFSDPALAWDAAASINNDGALFIIDHLQQIAKRMDQTRDAQFEQLLNASVRKVAGVVSAYFVNTNIDEILRNNIRKARRIKLALDIATNNDNYYFGHLIQTIQLTTDESYGIVHHLLQSPELSSRANDFDDYEIIRNSCGFERCTTDDERWEALLDTYGFFDRDEARETMAARGVDVDKLISGAAARRLNSMIIADAVVDSWIADMKSVEFVSQYADDSNTVELNNLVDDMVSSAEAVKLRDRLADAIAEYVNVVNISTANEMLLSDILSSKINDFVMDFGYSSLTPDERQRAEQLCQKHRIPAFRLIDKPDPIVTVDDLTAIFNELSSSPRALLPSFEENYGKWVEYMFISFISHLDIPDNFDIEANTRLGKIIEKLNAQTTI